MPTLHWFTLSAGFGARWRGAGRSLQSTPGLIKEIRGITDILAAWVLEGIVFSMLSNVASLPYLRLTALEPCPQPVHPVPVILPLAGHSLQGPRTVFRKARTTSCRRFASFNALTVSPTDARKGGGMAIPARQAQLAKAFLEAGYDAIGLQECRLPSLCSGTAGGYTCVYSSALEGCHGCGLWVKTVIAKLSHIAVIHQDPTRLAVAVRTPTFAMHALVLHSPVNGAPTAEEWWP